MSDIETARDGDRIRVTRGCWKGLIGVVRGPADLWAYKVQLTDGGPYIAVGMYDFVNLSEQPARSLASVEQRFKEAIIESYRVNGRARTVTEGADLAWKATKHLFLEESL